MCYASPGPRCSAHARSSLVVAQHNLDKANARHADLLEKSRLRGTTDQDMRRSDSPLGRAYAACMEAEKAAWRARGEYEATPDGIRELVRAADRIEDRLGFAQAEQDREYLRLLDRITEARMRRNEQLQAYKAANTGTSVGSPPVTAG